MEEQPVETTLYSLSEDIPSEVDAPEGERHLSLFRVGTVSIGDRRELCLIKNISAGGMLIRAYCAIEPGTRLSVELKDGEQIEGTTSWARGNSVGIEFDDPIDIVDLLSVSMEGPRPRMPRVEVRCIASVRQDANIFGMCACNVSQGGVKVESSRELAVGSDVVVTLPGLPPQAGVVRWRDGDHHGITFNRLLALSELVQWLHEQRELLRASS